MKTGYEISLEDFRRLCRDNPEEIAPLLRKWFSYELVSVEQPSPGLIGKWFGSKASSRDRGFQIRNSSGLHASNSSSRIDSGRP